MIYADVCAGISASTVAWKPLGWEAAFYSEIEPFLCKVLQHHYLDVPNLGNMMDLLTNQQFKDATIDLLVGGTPCQSFSIAGLRGGLADDRGNLALQFCRILIAKRPRWFVWENVPGVFISYSSGERDFGNILKAFRECGYCCAWRVLDAQYTGVPQQRRRVFVIGYIGDDWRPHAAVLFEPKSMRGDFTPRRKKGKDIAGTLDARTKGGGFPGSDGAMNGHVVATIDANYGRLQGASGQDLNHGHSTLLAFGGNNTSGPINKATSINAHPSRRYDFESETFILDPVIFPIQQITSVHCRSNPKPGDAAPTLTKSSAHNGLIVPGVRRLTPLECERLQGFPDYYTLIPGASDTVRYKAIGNSMAVPIMRWIGERINIVDKFFNQ